MLTTLQPWIRTLAPMEQFFVQQNMIEAVTSSFSDFEVCLAGLVRDEMEPRTKHEVREILDRIKTPMFACRLSEDAARFEGEPVRVLENDQPWEGHVVEGIWVLKHQSRYYMFYAGNDFSTAEYDINYALGDSPTGPFRKSPEPFLRTTAEWIGLGHPSVAIGLDGRHVLFFHTYFPGKSGYKQFRAFLSVPFDFHNGLPRMLDN